MTLKQEQAIFIGASIATWLHVVDEYFSGEPIPAVPILAYLVLNIVVAVFYQRVRMWRAAAALLFGLSATAQGLLGHVLPLLQRGAGAGDYSGTFLFVPGGLVLMGLGLYVVAAALLRRQHLGLQR